MNIKVGDIFKYHDGKYNGVLLVKEIMTNQFEVKGIWLYNTNIDTKNDQFTMHFLSETVFWTKL